MARRKVRERSKRSDGIEAVLMSAIWVMNLYEITVRFRAMSLVAGLTAGMIFLFAPVEVWRAMSAYRERGV